MFVDCYEISINVIVKQTCAICWNYLSLQSTLGGLVTFFSA